MAVAAIEEMTTTLLISDFLRRGTSAAVIQYVPVHQSQYPVGFGNRRDNIPLILTVGVSVE